MQQRRIGVRGIIHKDGKIFAVKHRRHDGSESKFWAIPGGGLDPNESITDGVKRELIEELGITPEVGRIALIQQFTSTREDCDEELELFFIIKNPDDFAHPDVEHSSHGNQELARYEFVDTTKVEIYPTIFRDAEFVKSLDNDGAPVVIHDQLNC